MQRVSGKGGFGRTRIRTRTRTRTPPVRVKERVVIIPPVSLFSLARGGKESGEVPIQFLLHEL